MTVLRSREIIPTISKTNSPPKTLKNAIEIEPLTPAKTIERSKTLSFNTTPSPSHLSQNSDHLRPGPESGSGCTLRRSLRLSSKSSSFEMSEIAISSRKRKAASAENVAICSKGSVLENAEHLGLDLGGKKRRVSERVKSKIRLSRDLDAAIAGEKMNTLDQDRGNIMSEEKVTGETNFSDVELSGSGYSREGDKGNGCLNLRSGKKVLKGRVKGIPNHNDDKIVYEDGKGGKKRESKTVWSRFSREEKKKGKLFDDDLVINVVGTVKLVLDDGVLDTNHLLNSLKPEEMEISPKAEVNFIGRGGRDKSRLSREEKGKGKLVEADLSSNGNDIVESDLEPKVENSFGSSTVSVTTGLVDTVARQVMETNVTDGSRRTRDYRERFRDFARKNASRFAHFPSQEVVEEENRVVGEAETEVPQEDATGGVEDWPGPFSTAMKIIKDREVNLKAQQPNSYMDKSNCAPLIWVPKKDQQRDRLMPVVPSLQELCLSILVKNADAITSLDSVPDVLRHQLSHLLCGCRKMNGHFLDLLVSGCPTEIRIRDCSWLSEEQFTRTFEGSDINKLTVLQLDQCGRCLPDYVLPATLARSPSNLAALTTISLKGACRLSDVGLRALVLSAPALRSINLSQCSLLTADGIKSLAETLRSVMKELYIDDCESVDAMLILPTLLKLEHLEVLSISGIQTVCDDFINRFVTLRGQNMKELTLAHCMKLTDSSLKAIAESCPGLCAIDLTNLCKLTDSAIGYLANGCQGIQILKLCRSAFSDEAFAAYLETCGESLKELSLNNVTKVANNTALSLAKHSRNLLSLDLSWCRNLTNEAVGLIVDSCLSLKVLKLFGCNQITSVFTNGHSNPRVQVIGLHMSSILQHLEVPELLGPLHYSSA